MALIHLNFPSQYLGNNTDVNIILPDRRMEDSVTEFYNPVKKYKVLWLLHGTFGDYTDWVRKTNIEAYACERNLMVVMPSGANAYYLNWPNFGTGYYAWDYLLDELMPLVYGWLPASAAQPDNFIAGLSMGGNGAMQYAVSNPEKFAGAASLSNAPTNLQEMKTPKYDGDAQGAAGEMFNKRVENLVNSLGGMESYLASPANIWDRLPKLMENASLPNLFFSCGENDKLIWEKYKKFKKHAGEIGLKAEFFEAPGYGHEWPFWDLSIQKALDFFGI